MHQSITTYLYVANESEVHNCRD